jgi:hypothetical protein
VNAEERAILPAARKHLTADDRASIHPAFRAERDLLARRDAQAAFSRLFHRIARLAPAPLGVG